MSIFPTSPFFYDSFDSSKLSSELQQGGESLNCKKRVVLQIQLEIPQSNTPFLV